MEGQLGGFGVTVVIGKSLDTCSVGVLLSSGIKWRGRVCFCAGTVGWVRCSLASSMSLVVCGCLLSGE